ncbi:MAG TPA: hypothetical protein VKE24_11945 [Candidatus Acidoferrales bacterium]|nr:hypothetical protein [Candidatus Acidoferrales bacterium]
MTTRILFVSTGNRVLPRCFGSPGRSRVRLEEWVRELYLTGDAR